MKLRLLNASHQALCYPGYLVGYRLVQEVAADENGEPHEIIDALAPQLRAAARRQRRHPAAGELRAPAALPGLEELRLSLPELAAGRRQRHGGFLRG